MFVLFVTRHLKTDSKKMYTLNLSQGAHPAGAYPGFHSMKGQGVLLLPPGWMVSPSQGSSHLPPPPPPQHFTWLPRQFAGTYHTPGRRKALNANFFAQEHITMNWPGLEPRSLNLETSIPTFTPLCLPLTLIGALTL